MPKEEGNNVKVLKNNMCYIHKIESNEIIGGMIRKKLAKSPKTTYCVISFI